MTTRTATIVLLFLAALLTTAVTLPLSLAGIQRFGGVPEPWLTPLVTLLCFVGVFHAGRGLVLPRSLLETPGRATMVITLWVGGALTLAVASAWLLRPVFVRYDIQQGTFVIVVAGILLAVAPLERSVRRDDSRSPHLRR